jgi:hypothetical protein
MTKDEYVEWKNSKVTREFINIVKNARFDLQEVIADGRYVESEIAINIGRCQGLKDAVLIALEGMQELVIDKEREDG